MTRGSIREYAEAVRGRYFGASKKEKGKMTNSSRSLGVIERQQFDCSVAAISPGRIKSEGVLSSMALLWLEH